MSEVIQTFLSGVRFGMDSPEGLFQTDRLLSATLLSSQPLQL